eukprot:ANDGO_00397.mRNA.2 putative peptide/nitrate transporter At3g43790
MLSISWCGDCRACFTRRRIRYASAACRFFLFLFSCSGSGVSCVITVLLGNASILKASVADVTLTLPSQKVAGLWSSWGLAWSLGRIGGAVIAGFLCRPAKSYPTAFSEDSVWGNFPYLLPCMVAGTVMLVTFAMSWFWYPETLLRALEPKDGVTSMSSQMDHGSCIASTQTKGEELTSLANLGAGCGGDIASSDERTTLLSASEKTKDKKKQKRPGKSIFLKLLKIPTVLLFSFITQIMWFTYIMFDEAFGIWAISDGGFRFTPADLGYFFAANGAIILLVQFFLYKHIAANISLISQFSFGALLNAVFYSLYPLYAMALSHSVALGWFSLIAGTACLIVSANSALLSFNTIVNASTSDATSFGALNGLLQVYIGIAKSAGAFVGGVIVAWELNNGLGFPFNSWFIFLLLAVLQIFVAAPGFIFKKVLLRPLDVA